MNIVNKLFLKLALAPSGIYRTMGVDIARLKAILVTKLIIDDRRPAGVQQVRKRKSSRPVKLATIATMVASLFLGLMDLFSFAIGRDMITHLTFYFSFFFFMLSASMISDFTSVLIDVRDNYIILPKPVNDATVLVARLLHIFIHVCKIVLPMVLPGLVYIMVGFGFGGGLLFLFLSLLVTLFAIFFINSVYLLILRFTTPQRFQSIISYVQIIFAIFIYASYQIFPRLVNELELDQLNIADYRIINYFPVYWFAVAWKTLYALQGTYLQWLMAVAGLLVPAAGIYLVVRYLAPSFNNPLALMAAGSGGEVHGKPRSVMEKKKTLPEVISRWLTASYAERMGFLFTWKMTARSRDFKLRVYPTIGYLVVYVVVMFMNNRDLKVEEIARQGTAGKAIIISAVYFSSLLLIMAISQIRFSEKYKAAWIYFSCPLERPGEVILGATKAAIFKFYTPLVLFITLTGLALAGPAILPNIILGLFNELLIVTILVYVSHKMLPFSQQLDAGRKTGGFLRGLMFVFLSGFIGLGHFFIYEITAAVLLCSVLSVLATWLMLGSICNISWNQMKSAYTEE